MRRAGTGALACAIAALALAPAIAAIASQAAQPSRPRVSLFSQGGIGSFTPAAADPKLAAALAGSDLHSTGLRFTPSDKSSANRQITVAVRARATRPQQSASSADPVRNPAELSLAPSAFNLGASVGWKKFALSADVVRVDTGLRPGSREAAKVGASYGTPKWSGRIQLEAARPVGAQPRLVADEESYAVDVASSYRLARNLNVTAGVRYQRDRDRLDPQLDTRRDSQAVYVGTVFKF